MIASDYGGDHRKSTHLIYCYLLIRSGNSNWISAVRAARCEHLPNGRTLSYKRLDDRARQQALVPFLKAASNLDGHLVAIAVDKKKKWLSTFPDPAGNFGKALQLKASWNAGALEAMLRKVQFVAILLSIWSLPHSDVTWITDEDEFVANDTRHDDALQAAARMCSLYFQHPMGIFRLNTTGQDLVGRDFEDLCAIPDLAAGALSEISTRLAQVGSWEGRMKKVLDGALPFKTELIADWFWDTEMSLRKTLITIDLQRAQFAVRKVWMQRDGISSNRFPLG